MSASGSDTALRVLFVEDHAHIRESIGMLLQAPDREVVCRESAEQALAAFDTRSFDVLITNVSLPTMRSLPAFDADDMDALLREIRSTLRPSGTTHL